MRRFSTTPILLAGSAFALLAGCGSSESDSGAAAPPSVATNGSASTKANPAAGKSQQMGPSPEILKAMQTDDYRKATFEAKYDSNGKPIERKTDAPTKEQASPFASIVLSEDEIKTINELSESADRELALAQKGCLVSTDDETKQPVHLGTMGKPFKTVINGKTVFLCCKGCLPELKKDPEKYLAKLPK